MYSCSKCIEKLVEMMASVWTRVLIDWWLAMEVVVSNLEVEGAKIRIFRQPCTLGPGVYRTSS
jgi:hypothetical protein